jgi:hypothetical protein
VLHLPTTRRRAARAADARAHELIAARFVARYLTPADDTPGPDDTPPAAARPATVTRLDLAAARRLEVAAPVDLSTAA